MNNNNEQQHRQQSEKDSEQGWCKVTFKLDTSEFPQIIKYPRGAPALPTSAEDVKKRFTKECQQDLRDQQKRQKHIKLSIDHPLFEGGKPDEISEKNIFFFKKQIVVDVVNVIDVDIVVLIL